MTLANLEVAFKALALYDHKFKYLLVMELWNGAPYGDGAITALWCILDANASHGYKVMERFNIRTSPEDLLPDLKHSDNFAAFITIPNGDWKRFSKIPAPRWYYYGV